MRHTLRRLVLGLTAVVAAASVVTAVTVAPVRADEGGRHCSPGSNCTGFKSDTYEVMEGTAYVDLAVYAAWCCPTGQGEIDYETADGSAVAGKDYQRTSGTLTYAGGGGGRIRVPISEDALAEGTEQFEVRLTNFRGTFVHRGYETAVVTIVDPTRYQPETGSAPADYPSKSTPGSPRIAAAPQTLASVAPPASGSEERGPASSGPQPLALHTENAIAPLPSAEKTGEGGPSSAFLVVLGCVLLATVAVGCLPFKRARRA